MARFCELTGRGPLTGNLVSHSNIKTKTRWLPNLKRKKYFIPELGRTITVRVTARAIRTIDKWGGFSQALRKSRHEKLSLRLQTLKRQLDHQIRKQNQNGQKHGKI